MRKLALSISVLLLTACASMSGNGFDPRATTCRPLEYDRAALNTLKENTWMIADDGARNAFALAATRCLGDPDPTMRDGIAFEALQHYMRERLLSTETLAALNADLQAKLTAPDPQGYQRPFAALVLAEVARTDRVDPWMSEAQRAQLIAAAISYIRGITDYRGFSPGQGYRHAVAHSADLMLQLVLNPAVGKDDLIRIRDAIGSQLAPTDHYYIYGESERLARPILYMATRDVFDEADWTAWFSEVAGPGALGASWDSWWLTERGLARRHNLMMFLGVIHANVTLSQNTGFAPLRTAVATALEALP